MAGSSQWTVADAIQSLQAVDTDNSCDEEEGDSPTQSIVQSVIQAATSDSSESESDDDSDLSTSANVGRGAVYLRPMSGTLFPVEQELLGNE